MASKEGSYGYRKYVLNRRLGRIEGQVGKATAATDESLNEPVDVFERFAALRR